MYILGLNAYHGDSSAALISNSTLIAAVEEERFLRIKHWSGFPKKSIQYCLDEAGISLSDLDYIALNRNSKANLYKKISFVLKQKPSLALLKSRFTNMLKIAGIKRIFQKEFSIAPEDIKARVINVEHHQAHLASSFYASGYDEATLVSIDGFGDFTSVMVAKGNGNNIKPLYQVNYPHSLGIFYSAFTQFLGFPKYGDEYKVMGLAGYGQPTYLDKMQDIVRINSNGRFSLNLKYFQHHSSGEQMQWNNTSPSFGRLYSDFLIDVFGQPRVKDGDMTSHYKDIAASVQAMYEKTLFSILNNALELTSCRNLCMAGGCAMNSLANGKIFDNTGFTELYIPSGAYDAGGAIGSAYVVANELLKLPRTKQVETSCWGPQYNDDYVEEMLSKISLDPQKLSIRKLSKTEELLERTAQFLCDGKIVGWFQGRMEWGARALGNRSILADPRRADMRDMINSKIKMRESFRPFAPSIPEEHIGEYFDITYPDPFMLKVYPIKKEKQQIIPAVTHVDGTGRLQTVSKKNNHLYWQLINYFNNLTDVPVLLNTSFNENEPIVCKPEEALDCFLRTSMDVLVLGNFIVERK